MRKWKLFVILFIYKDMACLSCEAAAKKAAQSLQSTPDAKSNLEKSYSLLGSGAYFRGIIDSFSLLFQAENLNAEQKALIVERQSICLACVNYKDVTSTEQAVINHLFLYKLIGSDKKTDLGISTNKKCGLCGCFAGKMLVPKEADMSLRCPLGKW